MLRMHESESESTRENKRYTWRWHTLLQQIILRGAGYSRHVGPVGAAVPRANKTTYPPPQGAEPTRHV
jgi:hypothetical protein